MVSPRTSESPFDPILLLPLLIDELKLIACLPHSHRKGDGATFPRNPKADELLSRLASELVDVDKVL